MMGTGWDLQEIVLRTARKSGYHSDSNQSDHGSISEKSATKFECWCLQPENVVSRVPPSAIEGGW